MRSLLPVSPRRGPRAAAASPTTTRRLARLAVAGLSCAALLAGCSGGSGAGDGSAGSAGGGGTDPEAVASASKVAASDEIGTPDPKYRIPAGERGSDAELAAYATRSYIKPGDDVKLRVSSTLGDFSVTAFRIGWYGGAGAARVDEYGPFEGTQQSGPVEDAKTGAYSADWAESASLSTDGWTPGLYYLHVTAGGKSVPVPVVVVSENNDGRVVVVGADTTWAAYNGWGGRSLYDGEDGTFGSRSSAVSFDRPYSSKDYDLVSSNEMPAVQQAARAGVPLGFATVTSIAQDPGSIDGAAGVISTGHDEYWPLDYRNALASARDAGSNLAFLGANAGYWRVRLEPSATGAARLVVGYKDAGADPASGAEDTTSRYRDEPDPLPENTVVGQLYDCFPAKGDLTVRQPDFFLFDGTGAAKGSTYQGLIGIEIDRVYPLKSTPRPIQVPALSEVTCGGDRTWSTMTYYTTSSGAGVFATGTMNWVRGLRGINAEFGIDKAASQFSRTVTQNLVRQMSQGPMGERHPAQDDLDAVSLPATNTTGAA